MSPLFADRLLAHPKNIDLADAVLLPITRMGPSANELQEEKIQRRVPETTPFQSLRIMRVVIK